MQQLVLEKIVAGRVPDEYIINAMRQEFADGLFKALDCGGIHTVEIKTERRPNEHPCFDKIFRISATIGNVETHEIHLMTYRDMPTDNLLDNAVTELDNRFKKWRKWLFTGER